MLCPVEGKAGDQGLPLIEPTGCGEPVDRGHAPKPGGAAPTGAWLYAMRTAPSAAGTHPAPGAGRQHLHGQAAGAVRGSCDRTAGAAGHSVFILLGRARRAAEGREGFRISASRPFPPSALFKANNPGRPRLRRLTMAAEHRRPGRVIALPEAATDRPGKIAPHNGPILREGANVRHPEVTTAPRPVRPPPPLRRSPPRWLSPVRRQAGRQPAATAAPSSDSRSLG